MKEILNLKIFIFLILVFVNSDLAAMKGVKEAPSKIRAVWASRPSETISLLWDASFGKKWDDHLYYDTVDHGRRTEKYRYRATPLKYTQYKGMNNALVRLSELRPDTKYYFLIKNSFGITKRFWFKTASVAKKSKISFIAGGDSRNNRTPRINANMLVAKLRPLFVLFGGDMTDVGTTKQWKRWFVDWQNSIAIDGRITPLIIVRGNHEARNKILVKLFDMPDKGYYNLSFSDKLLRVYVLNTQVSIGGNQTDWLLSELKTDHEYNFSTVIYHKPMRPHASSKKEGIKQYKYWAKPFYKHRVDLVVESDSHTVKSTYPIVPTLDKIGSEGFVRDDEEGTVYVGEGCWGAPLRRANDNKPWTRSSGSFNQFKLVFVDSKKMVVRTIITDNAAKVPSVSYHNPFDLPKELDIWTPKEGGIILIEKKNKEFL